MARSLRSLLAALATPETALIAGAAVVTAAVTHLPAVLLPGVLACAACALLRPGRDRRDPALEARVERCRTAHRQARTLLAGLSPAERALLAGADESLARLVASAERLATSLEQHRRDLAASDERALATECSALAAQRTSARDDETKVSLDHALAQHDARLQAHAALATRAGRLTAQLSAVEAALEAALAQLRRVRGLSLSPSASELAALAHSLAQPAFQAATVADAIDEAQRE